MIKVRIGKLADVLGGYSRAADHGNVSMRWVRGRKMRDEKSLFDEFAAALQFPEYFGENWHALADCLSDFSWWPAEARTILIADSAAVLADSESDFRLLMNILQRSAEEWAVGDSFREACPLDIVLHVAESESAVLRNRLMTTGAKWSGL